VVYILKNYLPNGFESCVLGVFVYFAYLFKRVLSSTVFRLHASTEIQNGTEKS